MSNSSPFDEARKAIRVAVAETKGFRPISAEEYGEDDFIGHVVSAVDEQDDEATLEEMGFTSPPGKRPSLRQRRPGVWRIFLSDICR